MSPGKMVLQSQATPKLWMASRQDQPPALSCHPHPEKQWKQVEALAAEWGRGLGWSVGTMKLHAKPTKLLRLGHFHISAMAR